MPFRFLYRPSGMRPVIVIPSFRGAFRLQRLLESVLLYDPAAYSSANWIVVEDPSDERSTADFRKVLTGYPAVFRKLPAWSNMHGAAMAAFEFAAEVYDPEWVIYLGDDILVTPNALSSMISFLTLNKLETVGLAQFPYWNAHELCQADNHSDRQGPGLLRTKEDMYSQDPSWLLDVPRNPHWEGEGYARPYINVNGVGFAARLSNYLDVGGFAHGTWCLDESIAVRTWLNGPLGVVCLPGPCLVHYFGAASVSGTPPHDLHTEERWAVAMGMSKAESARRMYEKLEQRKAAILAETKAAQYFSPGAFV